jgi:hypothetical protein
MPKCLKLYKDKLKAKIYRNLQRKKNYRQTSFSKNSGKPWEDSDIQLTLNFQGTDRELSKLLKRSVCSIQKIRWKVKKVH